MKNLISCRDFTFRLKTALEKNTNTAEGEKEGN